MDLSKLLAILVKDSIAFPRVDKFDDPYEGYASNYLELAKKSYMNNPFMKNAYDGFVETGLLRNLIKILNLNSYISCWHLNEYESAAMWKLYCKSSDSLVIKTTVGKLKYSLTDHINDLSFGGVIYDYKYEKTQNLELINLSDPLFTKRESFEHEKEFRVIYHNHKSFNSSRKKMEEDHSNYISRADFSNLTEQKIVNLESGYYYDEDSGVELSEKFLDDVKSSSDSIVNLGIDPTRLIEEIIISPDSPNWFVDTVKLTIENLGYEFPVRKSKLYDLD